MRAKRIYHDEVNTLPSVTDPSQNIELRTIVDRFVKGLPIPAVGHVLTPDDFDDEDNNFCPPQALDISEVKDLVDNASKIVDNALRAGQQSGQQSGQQETSNQTSADPAPEDTAKAQPTQAAASK